MKKIQQAELKCTEWRDKLVSRIDRIPMRRMAVYAGVLFVLSLIPLLMLGRYNVMCVDDYDYGRQIHDTWLATGSVWQSVRTAWQQNMEFYQEWQGTYISCFLMGLCPMNFNYEIAYVVPVLMIGMFAVSTYVLGRHILCRWLGAEKAGSSFVMFILLFMFYQVIEAPFEGIYWYNGATHYVLMESVWFFTLAAVSASLWARKKSGEALWCGLASVLAVIVGGGNLVTGLQAEIVMALLLLYAVVVNRKKILVTVLPFLTGSIGFLFNTLAPGNALRSSLDTDEGYSAVMSILLSFYHAIVFMIGWTPAFVIVIWLALLPVLWRLVKRSDKTFRHPLWVTMGALCVLAAMFTPTLYAVGMAGLPRVDNIIQMVYYLCLIMVTAYWLGYFAHREKDAGAETGGALVNGMVAETDGAMVNGMETVADGVSVKGVEVVADASLVKGAGTIFGSFLEKAGNTMTAVCLLLALIMWVFTADKNTYTSISALRSLANGEAQTFYEESMARHEIYIDENIVDVELKPYSVKPALFDVDDLSEDAGNWLNLAVMKYYHKAYVKVVPD